jgi:hypothetical protein
MLASRRFDPDNRHLSIFSDDRMRQLVGLTLRLAEGP